MTPVDNLQYTSALSTVAWLLVPICSKIVSAVSEIMDCTHNDRACDYGA
jgi:hypothetical protein